MTDTHTDALELIIGLLLLALPDETLQPGKRLNAAQVRQLNNAIVKAKIYVANRDA